MRAVQVGGPLGAYLPAEQLDLPMDYEAFAAAGAMVGHGGVVVFDDTVDMAVQARFAMEFCAEESCGKCTPCRIGSRARRRGDRPDHRGPRTATLNLVVLDDLCEVDGRRLAVRDGRPDPDAGAQRDPALPRGLRQAGRHPAAASGGRDGTRPARRPAPGSRSMAPRPTTSTTEGRT